MTRIGRNCATNYANQNVQFILGLFTGLEALRDHTSAAAQLWIIFSIHPPFPLTLVIPDSFLILFSCRTALDPIQRKTSDHAGSQWSYSHGVLPTPSIGGTEARQSSTPWLHEKVTIRFYCHHQLYCWAHFG